MSWKPEVSLDEAAHLLKELYGRTHQRLETLPGYDDANFFVQLSDGSKYVLKLAHFGESEGFLDMQNKSMAWLAKAGICAPTVVASLSGSLTPQAWLRKASGEKAQSYVRLLEYIDGITLLHATPSAHLYRSVGAFAAKLDQAWKGFSHPFVRTEHAWDIQNLMKMKEYLPSLKETGVPFHQIELVEKVFVQFEKEVLPLIHSLPSGAIHCDGNALNIIVDQHTNEVKAFIDFGDVSNSNYINELAILIAYCMLDKLRKEEKELDEGMNGKLLEVGRNVIQGYLSVSLYSNAELQLLPCLVKARLVTSILFSSHTLLQRPEDKEYLLVDARPGWVLLQILSSLPDTVLLSSLLESDTEKET